MDHKKIGVRYMVTAFGFFLLAGLLALVMRAQLALPNESLLPPEQYDQLFTMHGTMMIFFFATPMLSGFGNFLVPLMIGARDMAYPRLNAFGYWVFLFSGLFMFSSFLIGAAPDGGWFAYVPLTGPVYSPNVNIDFWALGLIFLSIATTAGAINFIVTIFKLRAPGMSVNRMPLFVWAILGTSFAIMFALPPLTAGNLLLLARPHPGHALLQPAGRRRPAALAAPVLVLRPPGRLHHLPAGRGHGFGSDPGHGAGARSSAIPRGVLATMTIGFIGFGVWVHHMFATGLPQLSLGFFGAASMLIAIPSGVQIFAWIATIWHGQRRWRVPFLFMLGFIVLFVIGGITGVMFAVVPFDWQATDTTSSWRTSTTCCSVAPSSRSSAALYYWLPKITGRMLSEKLGTLCFRADVHRLQSHLSSPCTSPAWRACRVASTRIDAGWAGPATTWPRPSASFMLGLAMLVFIIDYLCAAFG